MGREKGGLQRTVGAAIPRAFFEAARRAHCAAILSRHTSCFLPSVALFHVSSRASRARFVLQYRVRVPLLLLLLLDEARRGLLRRCHLRGRVNGSGEIERGRGPKAAAVAPRRADASLRRPLLPQQPQRPQLRGQLRLEHGERDVVVARARQRGARRRHAAALAAALNVRCCEPKKGRGVGEEGLGLVKEPAAR